MKLSELKVILEGEFVQVGQTMKRKVGPLGRRKPRYSRPNVMDNDVEDDTPEPESTDPRAKAIQQAFANYEAGLKKAGLPTPTKK